MKSEFFKKFSKNKKLLELGSSPGFLKKKCTTGAPDKIFYIVGFNPSDFNAMFASGELLFHSIMSCVDSSTNLLPAAPLGMLERFFFHLCGFVVQGIKYLSQVMYDCPIGIGDLHPKSATEVGYRHLSCF